MMGKFSSANIHPLSLKESEWLRASGWIVSRCCLYYPVFTTVEMTNPELAEYWHDGTLYYGRCGKCDKYLLFDDVITNDNLD